MTEPAWTILHGGALGDLVLTIQLALRLPHAEAGLHVISRTDPGDLSACRPPITRRSAEGLGMHWLHGADDSPPPNVLRAALAERRVLNLLGGRDGGVHRRLGLLKPAELYSVDPRPWPSSELHITQQWQKQLAAQGLSIPLRKKPRRAGAPLRVPKSLRANGRALLASRAGCDADERAGREVDAGVRRGAGGDDVVVIHPGSGGRAKCWPLPGFLACGELLADLFRVVFVLGPVELETWRASAIAAVEEHSATIRASSPDELVALLGGAAAFVGNDAGAAHLAALLGTPTVVVFGPTDARVWRPLGAYVETVAGDPLAGEDWGLSARDVAGPVVELVRRRNQDVLKGRGG